jgi:hypothetical protein
MDVQAAALGVANAAALSAGWKWLAVLIGLGVLAALYLLTGLSAKTWRPSRLMQGADGSSSTSKFQWLLWLVATLFAYTVLWVLRARQGDYAAIGDVPANLLTVLGLSTTTAAAAKGITTGYVQTGRVVKLTAAQRGATQAADPQPAAGTGGILQDDNGMLSLAKIQVTGFTVLAVGIFLATVIHQIAATPVVTTLPNIDSSLLALLGISQGGYLGNKLVTFGAPVLYGPSQPSVAPGEEVTLPAANLGSSSGAQLTLAGQPIKATSAAGRITFTVPESDPVTGASWRGLPRAVDLAVSAMGRTSNPVTFIVGAPAANPPG